MYTDFEYAKTDLFRSDRVRKYTFFESSQQWVNSSIGSLAIATDTIPFCGRKQIVQVVHIQIQMRTWYRIPMKLHEEEEERTEEF